MHVFHFAKPSYKKKEEINKIGMKKFQKKSPRFSLESKKNATTP